MHNKVRALSALLISIFLSIFASCSEKFVTATGNTWGTSYHITYEGPELLADSIRAVVERIDEELSMFNPASTVSRINNRTTLIASNDFRQVFELAKNVSIASGGVYDPTVAPLVDLWGFGRNKISRTPLREEIEEALPLIGIGDCSIAANDSIILKHPRTQFDFSSIAKGYGIDQVGAMLERNGVDNYMVEIGGEVLVYGHNPQGKRWHIQIDSPIESDKTLHNRLTVVELGPEHEAIATSGNYRNYLTDEGGKRYGHTISPLTGYPMQTSTLSATIKAPSCALADALATAAMLMDTTSLNAILPAFDATALVIVDD